MSVPKLFVLLCLFTSCTPRTYTSQATLAEKILLSPRNNSIEKTLFVPDDPVLDVLLDLIRHEKSCIFISLFRLSNKKIAEELITAHKRGVKIYLIIDCTALGDKSEKISLLQSAGIKHIYIYKHPSASMHHKCFLFFKNIKGKKIVWSGSANATVQGITKNEEYVRVSDNKLLFTQFENKLKQLIGLHKPNDVQINNPSAIVSECLPLLHSYIKPMSKNVRS